MLNTQEKEGFQYWSPEREVKPKNYLMMIFFNTNPALVEHFK